MYLAISLVLAVCAIGLLIGLLYVQSGKKSLDSYCKKLKKDNDDTYKACINLLNKKAKELDAAHDQARAFEQAAKTMEEHLAAERGRADRLAEALRMSEDARCELKQKLAKAQEESRKRSSMDTQLKRELLNLFRYDGTAQSQEDLIDE